MPRLDLGAKVREYEAFANDVLKVDLQKTVAARAARQAEVEELEELRRELAALAQAPGAPLKARVELGPGVLCRAVAPDTSRVCVAIGLGFHLECTHDEAGRAIDLRQAALRAEVARCVDKAARIKANLKFVFKEASVKKLYKDLMMLARFMGRRQGNEGALVEQVRQQFRMNMHETDETKILAHKEAAMRALSNIYFQEAERLARKKRKMSECGDDADGDQRCYICLEGPSNALGPLQQPCACKSLACHSACLARWQLQSAGREEERMCRFCRATLPSWKDAFAHLAPPADAGDDGAEPAPGGAPVMSIQFRGATYFLEVTPGHSVERFKGDVRRLLGLGSEQAFDITFECTPPGQDGSSLELQGLQAFDAAVYLASLSAARRTSCSKGGAGWQRSRSSSGTGSSSAGSDLGRASLDGAAPAGSTDGGAPRGAQAAAPAPAGGRAGLRGLLGGWQGGGGSGRGSLGARLLQSVRYLWSAPADDLPDF
ncbi:UXT-like protein [Scenedesmus sp. PABB004]|nr:UXT-like protein [Scenedesmus sp. PABB004]